MHLVERPAEQFTLLVPQPVGSAVDLLLEALPLSVDLLDELMGQAFPPKVDVAEHFLHQIGLIEVRAH